MNRPTCAVLVLAGLAAGCELVAGIQDKYLSTADAGGAEIPPSETGIKPGDDSTDASIPGTEGDATDPRQPREADVALDAGSTPPQQAVDATDAGATVTPAMDTGGGSGPFSAPDAGSTDPSAPCSAQPAFVFCDDFDTETTVSDSWGWSLSSIDGGSTAFSTAAYTSSPRSVQIVAPPALSPHNQMLGVDLGVMTGQVRLAFDLRLDIDTLSTLPDTAIAQILGARQGTPLEIDYLLRPNQGSVLEAYVAEDGGPASNVNIDLPTPPLRAWTRIVIVYDVSAGITVFEDGIQVGASAVAAAGAPMDTKIQVGMIYEITAASATLEMEMDNIVVRGH
jgi:hypothetical protein